MLSLLREISTGRKKMSMMLWDLLPPKRKNANFGNESKTI